MNESLQVAAAPVKPLVIFDGDCPFCRAWIARWEQATGNAVAYVPFQDPSIAVQFPELSRSRLRQAVHLIGPDGRVDVGAAAVFRALAAGGLNRLAWLYEHVPGFAPFAESLYATVAGHRTAAWGVTRLLWGNDVLRPSYELTRWVFLRLLGLIYLVAFVSLWSQIDGLVGSHGILPVARWIETIEAEPEIHFFDYPTLVWLSSADSFLHVLCAGGVVCSILLVTGIAPAPALLVLWAFYLSLLSAGQVFLSYQWDVLLLETGLLAIFFAPWQLWPRIGDETAPSRIMIGLLRWLVFRLMFQSGCVKLLSRDATWWNLTALEFHYETQPLPTWIGWYAHQLPAVLQHASVLVMFAVELGVSFLVFLPRRARQAAFVALCGLQLLIAATGNYCFFNLLALLLCLTLLDDALIERFLPGQLVLRARSTPLARRESLWIRACVVVLASVVLLVSACHLGRMFSRRRVPAPIRAVYRSIMPFHSINSYGLFAVMTTRRREIIIEGSVDGREWRPFEFKYKPGDLARRPAFVAPHQPRLDWQMWFAALDEYRSSPWLLQFMIRLLEGSPEVVALLGSDPFPNQPPRYVRAMIYDYRFTDFSDPGDGGAWWRRELLGLYCPILTLDTLGRPRAVRFDAMQ